MREFLRGPLARVSYELDSAFYGTVAYNRRVVLEHAVKVLFAALRQMGICAYGHATPTPEEDLEFLQRPRPRLENTYHWINKLHHIGLGFDPDVRAKFGAASGTLDNPTGGLGAMTGWENFSAWRLDALLGLSGLPPSSLRAFTLYMDGYQRSEIAELMPADEGEPWDVESVRSALKECSRTIRRRTEMTWPAKGGAKIQAPVPTTEVRRAERAVARVRSELDRRKQKGRLTVIAGVGERQIERRRERRQRGAA